MRLPSGSRQVTLAISPSAPIVRVGPCSMAIPCAWRWPIASSGPTAVMKHSASLPGRAALPTVQSRSSAARRLIFWPPNFSAHRPSEPKSSRSHA